MRSRISWLVVATTSTIVVSFVVPLCLLVRTLAEDRAMSSADQQARNVAILVAAVSGDRQLRDFLAGVSGTSGTSTSVLTARGRQIGGGPPMADDPEVRRALDGEAFRVVDDAGGRVLLPVLIGDTTAVVRTTVSAGEVRQGVTRAWLGILGLGATLMAAAVLVARQMGNRISEPLLEVAGTAHRLREGDLDARAAVRGTAETQELARALNGLAERTTDLLASERAAVGDLSHRLRTPVTALRLDAEAVDDPALAGRLQEHIAVLQRTIDAIVHEARRPVRTDFNVRSDLAAVVTERVGFWRPLAEDQDRPLQVRLQPGPLPVDLAESDLRDLVDVLIDNVFAHTPEGTAFTVDLEVELSIGPTAPGRAAKLIVSDAGPGLTDGAGPRRPGTTGLGLGIVARTAHAGGGSLSLGASAEGGVRAEVRLPVIDRR